MDRIDSELVERSLAGDEAALSGLFARHGRALHAFIYRMVGDADIAEGLAADAFVKAWKHLRRFDRSRSFRTWILAIARTTALDHLKGGWTKRMLSFSFLDVRIHGVHGSFRSGPDADEGLSFEETLADPEPLPDELFKRAELGTAIERALMTVSPASRSVVLLHLIDELPFEEIAEMLNEPMNTVKSRYRRALGRMREVLAADRADLPHGTEGT